MSVRQISGLVVYCNIGHYSRCQDMHDVKNIPELIALLMPEGEPSFEVCLRAELHKTLRVCLELGVAELIALDPYCLPPRLGAQLRQKHRFQGRVYPADFGLDSPSLQGLDERIRVDADMVKEGVGWVEHVNYHPRLTNILTQVMAQADACAEGVAEVPRGHLQELVDWLDMIVDNRPNRLASALRDNVATLNTRGLLPKFEYSPQGC